MWRQEGRDTPTQLGLERMIGRGISRALNLDEPDSNHGVVQESGLLKRTNPFSGDRDLGRLRRLTPTRSEGKSPRRNKARARFAEVRLSLAPDQTSMGGRMRT